MVPDASQWRHSNYYDYFDDLGVSDLAWEYLRRNVEYQRDYAQTIKQMDDLKQAADLFRLRWGAAISPLVRAGTHSRSRYIGRRRRIPEKSC